MQAHECSLNWDMRESDKEDVERYNILAREAAQVSENKNLTFNYVANTKLSIIAILHLRCIFLFKLSAKYEALKDSMSEAASIPPSWCTLAEVITSKTNTKQYL